VTIGNDTVVEPSTFLRGATAIGARAIVGPLTTVIEISAWLAAFLMWVFAGVLMVNRLDWRRPVVVVVGTILVLLAITFLFPPLWLRGLLDLLLLGGLTWAVRQKPGG